MRRIVSFDLSLTATGWASSDGGSRGTLTPPKGQDRGMARLAWIRNEVLCVVGAGGEVADLVVLEGYSFGSKGRAVFDVAELGGVVRLALYRCGIRFVDVPPAVLKRYATGKGNASKELVLVEAVRRLGYEGSDHNEADALWLLEMGLDRYGLRESRVPQAHRMALGSVEWPELLRSP